MTQVEIDGTPMKIWIDTRVNFMDAGARPIMACPLKEGRPEDILYCHGISIVGDSELMFDPGPNNPRVYIVANHVKLHGVGPETPLNRTSP